MSDKDLEGPRKSEALNPALKTRSETTHDTTEFEPAAGRHGVGSA